MLDRKTKPVKGYLIIPILDKGLVALKLSSLIDLAQESKKEAHQFFGKSKDKPRYYTNMDLENEAIHNNSISTYH